MADNYLEKRMEDYLRQRRSSGTANQTGKTAHGAGKQEFKNKKICVVAPGAESEVFSFACNLRDNGASVAVFIADGSLAQKFVNIGARVYCVEPGDERGLAEKFAEMMRHYFNLFAVCNLSPLVSEEWLRSAIDAYETSLPLPPASPSHIISGSPETVLHILAKFVKNKF